MLRNLKSFYYIFFSDERGQLFQVPALPGNVCRCLVLFQDSLYPFSITQLILFPAPFELPFGAVPPLFSIEHSCIGTATAAAHTVFQGARPPPGGPVPRPFRRTCFRGMRLLCRARARQGPTRMIKFFLPSEFSFLPQNALFAQTPSFFAQRSTYARARTSPRISGISD